MTKTLKDRKALEALQKECAEEKKNFKQVVTVCGGTGCHAYGCKKVIEAFRDELSKQGLDNDVRLRVTGCHGFCEMGSLAVISPSETFYVKIDTKDVPEIVEQTIKGGKVIERLLYTDPTTGEKKEKVGDVPFYKNQERIIFGQNGHVDPTNLRDYLAIGGYSGAAKALFDLKPGDIVSKVKESGLRGRGGGGFSAGRKWELCAGNEADERYVVCNADEGDPGAYMDRSLLEGNPHAVIEGMIIGARAIGSRHGYVYVRNEYPLAVENLGIAIEQAIAAGLLGKDILGSGFDFDITINRGGGAFVCGEETGLLNSVMGLTGEPRPKPPYPAQAGLWGKPTIINNVETWANVPMILDRGEKWFSSMGTAGSKGTKVFSLVGKINNTGLVEVPMGITLRKIVYDIGGGIPGGRKFKAVQTGGPSGGCIPESMLDMPVDFDELTKIGSMMGSGGMIVMDDRTCMVDIARYFLNFLREESCGKCVPCREGVPRMQKILDDICEGRGDEAKLVLLEELAQTVRDASLCGLGQTAPNPVLSTLKHFRHEYEAHIRDKKCPAGVCKALITYGVSEDKCTGCTACARACPTDAAVATDQPAKGAIKGKVNPKLKMHRIVHEKCIKCGACFDACKYDAIEIK